MNLSQTTDRPPQPSSTLMGRILENLPTGWLAKPRRWVKPVAVGAVALGWGLLVSGVEKSAPAPVKPVVTAVPVIPVSIRDALQARDFAEAVKLIHLDLQKNMPSGNMDYLQYLLGRAYFELDKPEEAHKAYQDLVKQFPESPWVARAWFGRAAIYAKVRNYQAAGEIYKTQAEQLLSAGRRDELTKIILEFADRFFEGRPAQGPLPKEDPNYEQALSFYQQAIQLRPSLDLVRRVELRIARCQQQLQKWGEAVQAYQAFLKNYGPEAQPKTQQAPLGLLAEAQFQYGQTQLSAGAPAEARKIWQDFLNSPADKVADVELLAQAQFKLAQTYGIPQPPTVGDLELGVEALTAFVQVYPKHKLAAEAEYLQAQSYLHHQRHDQAIAGLKSLIAQPLYAQSEFLPKAWQLIGQSYTSQKKFVEAIAAYQQFLEKFPTDAAWSTVQQAIIDTEFLSAQELRQRKQYAAARKEWETFLNKYPLDGRAAAILFQFGDMQREQARVLKAKPETAKNAEAIAEVAKLFDEAITDWQRLVAKYPQAEEASRAALLIGELYEVDLGKLTEAIAAYKKVTGPHQPEAENRLRTLTSPSLKIVTARKYRSNEKPQIELTTRNLKQVTVKLYRVDLTDYFRKLHLATGVEGLDIALIDPDKSLDHVVEKYEEFRQIEQPVVLPVEGPGVYAVTVSSETHEATTMVVVSDLDLVAKSSRNETFVYVQNMLTGKPAAGVKLMLSDGSQVFAEETTGPDGVLQKKYDQLKSINDLRVFAHQEAHSASSQLSLNGLEFAVGLSPKGYLFTDRPAYRPGELVHLKGLIRWVAEDRYTFKKGERYQLDVFDAQGRSFHMEKVELGDFGTFAAHWRLPSQAPVGDYRIVVRQPGKDQVHETQFTVQEFQLEPVQLIVDVPRTVYYRGEKITGKLQLKYYYGTPLAGRTIQYQLGDDRLHTATTDDKGEISFEFPTQRYSETQSLVLVANYAERNLRIGKPLFLATRGFDIGVNTVRPVYIAGETFDASLTVNDPEGKPVGAAVTLELIEQIKTDTGTAEQQVQKFDVKVDDKTGKAHQTLRVEKSGSYIVRATAKDRFGHIVTGSRQVTISGDDDTNRLRILADQHHYKVGDTGKLQLHWRDAPALGLVTFEGASVLGYRLVELKTGANPLELTFEEAWATNIELAVTVMQGNKLHEARSPFQVARELLIQLKPAKAQAKPGEILPVEIVVTDSQGKPVSAEVTLGMVEQSLLNRFPDTREPVALVLNGQARKIACRASSSCTFQYAPETRPINAALIQEVARLSEQERETVSRSELAARFAAPAPVVATANTPAGIASGALGGAGDLTDREAKQELAKELSDKAEDSPADESQLMEEQLDAAPQSQAAFGANAARKKWSALGRRSRDAKEKAADGRALGKRQSGVENLESFDMDSDGIQDWKFNALYANANDFSDYVVEYSGDITSSDGTKAYTFNLQQVELAINQAGNPQLRNFGLNVLSNTPTSLAFVNGLGEMQLVNGRELAQLEKIANTTVELIPGQLLAETGYWNPAIVSDAQGKATLAIPLPDRSTAWKLRANGTTAVSLAGQAEADFITAEDLFLEVKAPLSFTAGDSANILVEVHNGKLKETTGKVVLRAVIGDKAVEQKQTVKLDKPGISELNFPISITPGEHLSLTATITSGELKDSLTRNVVITPNGWPVVATAGGSAAQNTSFQISYPDKLEVQNPQLELLIGPTVDRALLDVVLGGQSSAWERSSSLASNPMERAVSDILGGVSLLKMIGQTRDANTPEAREISGKIQAAISTLVASQRGEGGWSWVGTAKAEQPDRFLSSRCLWALAAARDHGFAVHGAVYDKGVQYLNTALAASVENDHETRAVLTHGLTMAGAGDFAQLNKLHRNRNAMSASSLVHVALSLIAMDRKPMAQELLSAAKTKLGKLPAANTIDEGLAGCHPWMQNGAELRGLYLYAINQITPAAAGSQEIADWLLSVRVGGRWMPEKANGPVVIALADWFGRAKLTPEKYTLSIFVNDKLVTKLAVDPGQQPTAAIPVPEKFLVAGKPQRVNIDLEGRGRFSYSATMTGFVPSDKLRNTADRWHFNHQYEPAQRMLDGELIPRGFGHINWPYESFTNPLTQLPLGERGEVTINIWRHNTTGAADEHREYLIYTEPLPAGTSVLTETIVGNFDRYEITPGAITFYLGDRPHPGQIRFSIVGYLPGKYLSRPSLLRNFYEPGQFVVATPLPLQILGRGEVSKDVYRLTPIELYELGKRYFGKRDFVKAAEHLTPLFTTYKLSDIYKEVVQMLFECALVAENPGDTVRYFEIIKEKFPDVEVSFESILRVAESYVKLGEYERSYLVYRATLEAAFQRESQLAGFLDQRGEFLRSVAVMEQLLRSYPAEAYVATATFALTQEVYGKATELAQDAKLQQTGLTKIDLITAAYRQLENFLITWPTDPAADQASFSVANALLDLQQYPELIARCEQFAQRYPESTLLDSFWYLIGYGQFARGKHEEALAMCRKVAEWKRVDPGTKVEVAAVNQQQAIYIMGQIFHSLNKPAEAVSEYKRVQDRFSDAKEALDFFLRKDLSFEEVTTVKPGASAKVMLKFRNVAGATVKVYRIDLLKFGLLNRNLSHITAINLAGIRPYHELTVKLGEGLDYRDKEQELELPLKDEGAYLVVGQGDNLYASGLVLVTPLSLEVQEDAVSRRVRVTVKDVVEDRYLHDVGVKVIGSVNDGFLSGQTDLRGIYVADGILGTSTVIAKAGNNRYAFHRGKIALGGIDHTPNDAPAPAKAEQWDESGLLLDQLRIQNSSQQQLNRGSYRKLLKNEVKGIQAKDAF